MISRIADKLLTRVAKAVAKTGCIFYCHREEIPNELL
jgi:cyclic lactone autoinducer peptide